jgi:hypothetical protein
MTETDEHDDLGLSALTCPQPVWWDEAHEVVFQFLASELEVAEIVVGIDQYEVLVPHLVV